MSKDILTFYCAHQRKIEQKIQEFRQLPEEKYLQELIFCLLTPQSNAQRCWDAVQKLQTLKKQTPTTIKNVLRTRIRFHNNKTRYVLEAKKRWPETKNLLNSPDRKSLRNALAENILGMGYKEAGHFLRNIGKSNNQIAILDRHILRNLHELRVISKKDLIIKSKQHYFKLEKKFLAFSSQVHIPIDHLDLLFWSKETGEIFK